MINPKHFYLSQIKAYRSESKKAAQKLAYSSLFRVLTFLITAYLVYYFMGNGSAVITVLIAGAALFAYLVSRHTDLKYDWDKFRELIRINKIELEVLEGKFSDLPSGTEFDDALHPFSQDIDLFGKGSFFQYLNRTSLPEGRKRLAALLLSNDTSNIPQKQEAIKELMEIADWRQRFSALAALVKTEAKTKNILSLLYRYKSFVPFSMKWLPWVFSVISGLVITAYVTEIIGGLALGLWFFAGLGITSIYLSRINALSHMVERIQQTFHQYYQLLDLIESTDFSSVFLQEQKMRVTSEKERASKILKKFSKAIDALDQRNNMIFGILGNGFLLWDLRQSFLLERWIIENNEKVEAWFQVIEILDAYNSLGNYAFNHPDHVFPSINDDYKILETKKLGHPLLPVEKRVDNDFTIGKEEFFIITGANMAGKSTFLRTVGLQIMMGNLGLPVCAGECYYTPIKLITSMRTSDSLTDEESYFFSELKRLKFIVDAIKEDRYFIILDEILKGTNSTDKAVGSRKFVEKLVRSRSTGIIATHDLNLCEVAEDLPMVSNFYFDAEILKDELNFDYQLKNGICKNMNASFLLNKMGIVD